MQCVNSVCQCKSIRCEVWTLKLGQMPLKNTSVSFSSDCRRKIIPEQVTACPDPNYTRFGADLTCMLNTGRLMVWYYRENYYSNENESFNWPEHLNNPAHGAAAWNAKFKVSEWFLCFSRDSLWQDWQEEQSPPSAHAPPHISHPVSTEICGDLCNSFHCCCFFVSFKELTAMNEHQTQSEAEKWSRCFFLYRWQWAER